MYEIDEKEFSKLEKVKVKEVYEVNMKFWKNMKKELELRFREKKYRIWKWKRDRDLFWRESEDDRVLELLRRLREKEKKRIFREFVIDNGNLLFCRYSKVLLRNRDNLWYEVEWLGVRREDGKKERVKW